MAEKLQGEELLENQLAYSKYRLREVWSAIAIGP